MRGRVVRRRTTSRRLEPQPLRSSGQYVHSFSSTAPGSASHCNSFNWVVFTQLIFSATAPGSASHCNLKSWVKTTQLLQAANAPGSASSADTGDSQAGKMSPFGDIFNPSRAGKMLTTGNIFTTAPRPSDHANRPCTMAVILRRSSPVRRSQF